MGHGPLPPEVDLVEVATVRQIGEGGISVVTLNGKDNYGESVTWVRVGKTKYYTEGEKFKFTADPLGSPSGS